MTPDLETAVTLGTSQVAAIPSTQDYVCVDPNISGILINYGTLRSMSFTVNPGGSYVAMARTVTVVDARAP
jgi:hypothetical protein